MLSLFPTRLSLWPRPCAACRCELGPGPASLSPCSRCTCQLRSHGHSLLDVSVVTVLAAVHMHPALPCLPLRAGSRPCFTLSLQHKHVCQLWTV